MAFGVRYHSDAYLFVQFWVVLSLGPEWSQPAEQRKRAYPFWAIAPFFLLFSQRA
jgi:hypothetical protein